MYYLVIKVNPSFKPYWIWSCVNDNPQTIEDKLREFMSTKNLIDANEPLVMDTKTIRMMNQLLLSKDTTSHFEIMVYGDSWQLINSTFFLSLEGSPGLTKENKELFNNIRNGDFQNTIIERYELKLLITSLSTS